jgi:hypothetical protein
VKAKKEDQLMEEWPYIYFPKLTVGLSKLDVGTRSQTAVGFLEYVLPFRDTCRELSEKLGNRDTRIANEIYHEPHNGSG